MPKAAARILLTSFLVAVSFSALALAAPDDDQRARARALMDEADQMVEKRQFDGALQRYREAHSIMNVTTTGIEVARTLSRLGRLVEAKRTATEVASLPATPGEPQAFAQARADAAALAQELDRRVPRLTVVTRGLATGTTLRLRIDGKPVSSSENDAAHELDPGSHEVFGEAGTGTASLRIVLKEGERQTVTLAFAESEAAGGAPPPVVADAQTPSSSSPTLGYVIGGIGVAGLAVAGVTSAVYFSRHQKIKDDCPDGKCTTDEGYDRVESNRQLGVINLVAWGIGLVGTGVGGYLILSHRSKEKTAITPAVTPRGASLTFHRSF